jgi:phosphoribosylglycinamide formyltransferase-1
MGDPLKLAIAVSGSGTCMDHVFRCIDDGSLDARVAVVITDVPDCTAIGKAKDRGVPTLEVPVPNFKGIFTEYGIKSKLRTAIQRFTHEKWMLDGYKKQPGLMSYDFDGLVMLGYERILANEFRTRMREAGKFVDNTHPAPMPEFRGIGGYAWGVGQHKQSAQPGVKHRWHSVNYHDGNAPTDTGRKISESPFEVKEDDTEETLKQRGMQREYQQIFQCLQWRAQGRVIPQRDSFDVLDEDGHPYSNRLSTFTKPCPEGTSHRYVVDIREQHDFDPVSGAGDIRFNLEVYCTGDGRESLRHTQLVTMPYNLAFTLLHHDVRKLRRAGHEVSFQFGELDIHPVIMKSDC